MNTSHRHLYVFTGCRLSLESISRLLCSVLSAFMTRPQLSKKHGCHQEDLGIQPPLEHQYPVVRPFTTSTIEKNASLAIEPFPMHPPRFRTVSHNHYSHSKILTPLSHCLKLTILEKRLIYSFFLVFPIVYTFAFYCKFKIVNG